MPPDKRYESKSTFTTTNNSGAKNEKKKKEKFSKSRGIKSKSGSPKMGG